MEKPIIFGTPMVQALLNTKPGIWPAEPIDPAKPFKSQTRRIPKNYDDLMSAHDDLYNIGTPEGTEYQSLEEMFMNACPYHVGDVFWVREKWCKLWKLDENDLLIEGTEKYYYSADGYNPTPFNYFPDDDGFSGDRDCPRWKPSIFMPHEAARLFLEVKSVRVELVQNISEEDAISEGVITDEQYVDMGGSIEAETYCPCPVCNGTALTVGAYNDGAVEGECQECDTAIKRYRILWDSLNAKRGYGWESNPWVWVYEFMRIK
jgi:hypothetical protein